MRVVFMGTPDFAVGTLKAIIEAGHDVAAVVTQPDKPRGRSKSLVFSPVYLERQVRLQDLIMPRLRLLMRIWKRL